MRKQREKTKAAEEAAVRDAQAAQANLCRTTVISVMDATEDRTPKLVALVKSLGHRGRFDLLTVPDHATLVRDDELFGQVARDAALAITLHHGEQIVVAVYGDPGPVVRRLKEAAEFRNGGVEISGFDLREAGRPMPAVRPVVAVTCMDFRQHDADLPERLRDAFGLRMSPSVLATAGGAKDLVDSDPRGALLIERLKRRDAIAPIERIVLTCHTDCGAMGGDAAPAFLDGNGRPDPRRQLKVLRERLKASALSVRVAFPRARVATGIVRLKDGAIAEIMKA